MNRHYIGKETMAIDGIDKNDVFENKLLLNNGFDKGKEYSFNVFERCTFSKVSFNEIKIKNSDYKYSVFIECYFKKTQFKQVSFENCTFINCGFHDMTFENCNFFYTEWDNSFIKFESIKNSLPNKFNYRKKICKTMAQNCLDAGNIEEYKKFFFESIKAKEDNYKEIILRRDEYYKKRYNLYDSGKYFLKFIFSKLLGLIWGYGEKIRNVIYSTIFVLFSYSAIYYNNGNIIGIDSSKYMNSLLISLGTFFNVDVGATFNSVVIKYLGISEYVLGLIFMGMFIAYLFRSISSR